MANNVAATTPKKPKGSRTGFVLALVSLALSGIGYGLVRAHFNGSKPATTTAEKVDGAVANGTGHAISSILSLPFLVVGFTLAALAVLFVLIRFSKGLKAGALLFSIASLLLSFWSFRLVAAAFHLLKATSST